MINKDDEALKDFLKCIAQITRKVKDFSIERRKSFLKVGSGMDVLPYSYGLDSNGICWGYYVECYMNNDNALTWTFDLVTLPSNWRMSYRYSINGNRSLIEKEIERKFFKDINDEVLGFIEESFKRVDEALELMKS